MLVSRLKQLMEQKHRMVQQEHEITDEQIEIQAILEAKARERERAMSMEQPDYSVAGEPEPEALPVPAAMIHDQSHDQHPGKRQHGMNACKYSLPMFFIITIICKEEIMQARESRAPRKISRNLVEMS